MANELLGEFTTEKRLTTTGRETGTITMGEKTVSTPPPLVQDDPYAGLAVMEQPKVDPYAGLAVFEEPIIEKPIDKKPTPLSLASPFDETGIRLPERDTLLEQLPKVEPLTRGAAETAAFAPPPQKGFVKGLVESAREMAFIPFGDVTELTDMAFILSAAKRMEAGKGTYEDEEIINDFMRQSQQPATTGYKIAQGLMQLPAFMGELALTAGAYTGVKFVAGRTLTKALARYAESKAGKAVLATLPRLTGVAAQTSIARAPGIVAGTMERMLPTIQLNPDEASELNFTIQHDEAGIVKAFTKSFASQMIEVGTERAGNLIDKLPAGQIFQAALARYLRINPTKRVADFMSMTRDKMLRNSFIAETIEEEIAKPLHVLLGTETGLRGKEDTWSNRFREQYNLENYLVQTVVLSVPTAGGVALQKFATPRMVSPEYRASAKEQINLLNEVSEKLKETGNTYGVEVIEGALAGIKESGKGLTNQQIANVLRVANQQVKPPEPPILPEKIGAEMPIKQLPLPPSAKPEVGGKPILPTERSGYENQYVSPPPVGYEFRRIKLAKQLGNWADEIEFNIKKDLSPTEEKIALKNHLQEEIEEIKSRPPFSLPNAEIARIQSNKNLIEMYQATVNDLTKTLPPPAQPQAKVASEKVVQKEIDNFEDTMLSKYGKKWFGGVTDYEVALEMKNESRIKQLEKEFDKKDFQTSISLYSKLKPFDEISLKSQQKTIENVRDQIIKATDGNENIANAFMKGFGLQLEYPQDKLTAILQAEHLREAGFTFESNLKDATYGIANALAREKYHADSAEGLIRGGALTGEGIESFKNEVRDMSLKLGKIVSNFQMSIETKQPPPAPTTTRTIETPAPVMAGEPGTQKIVEARAGAPISDQIKVESTTEGKVISAPVAETKAKREGVLSGKEQKKYLLAELDKAVEDAPDIDVSDKIQAITLGYRKDETLEESRARETANQKIIEENKKNIGTVIIEVPGDGTFELYNTKKILSDFREGAAKKFPTTAISVKEGKLPTVAPTRIAAVTERPTPEKESEFRKMLEPFVSEEEGRENISTPWRTDKNEMVATDGRRLVVVTGIKGKAQTDKTYPDYTKIVPGYQEGKLPAKQTDQTDTSIADTEQLIRRLIQAQNIYDKADKSYGARMKPVKLFLMPDGTIGVSSKTADGYEYQSGDVSQGKYLASFQSDYLVDILSFLQKTGNKSATLRFADELSSIVLLGANEYAVLMPMRISAETIPGAQRFATINEAQLQTKELAKKLGGTFDETEDTWTITTKGGLQFIIKQKGDLLTTMGKPAAAEIAPIKNQQGDTTGYRINLNPATMEMSALPHEILGHAAWDSLSAMEKETLRRYFGRSLTEGKQVDEELAVLIGNDYVNGVEHGTAKNYLGKIWAKIKAFMDALMQFKFGKAWQEIKDLPTDLRTEWIMGRMIRGEQLREVEEIAEPIAEQPRFAEPVGKPHLAIPAVMPEARELFRAVDQREKELGIPATRHDKEVMETARKTYDADPRAWQLKVLTKQIKYDNDVQVRMAKMALNDMATQGMLQNDVDKISEAIVGKIIWRQAGTVQARGFRARMDEMMSPERRMVEALQDALLYPNSKVAKLVENLDFESAVKEVSEFARDTQKRRNRLIIELGIDPANLDEATQKDPYKMAALIREVQLSRANWGDWIYEFWRNSILSGIPTQGANIIGNTGNLTWNYTFQRLAEATVNMMVKAPNAPTFNEIKFMYKHIYPGILRAQKNALISFATEQPVLEGMKVEEKGVAIPGIAGRGIRLPQRFLLMADEAAKGLIYQMELASLAYRQVSAEGLNNKEEKFYQRIETLLAQPTAEMNQQALDEAKRLTFQEELETTSLGQYAKSVMKWREKGGIGGWMARFIFPFVKTPTNIITQGMRASPFGAIRMVRKAIEGEYKGLEHRPELVRDAAQQVLAATVTSVLWALVSGDDDDEPWITGSKKSYQRPGEQAYQYKYYPPQSFRIGNRWVSYGRIEPLATALTPIIDIIYLLKTKRGREWDSIVEDLTNTLKAQVRDKTFLTGIGDIIKAFDDDRRLRNIGESFLASWNPNIIRSIMRASDDYIRQYSAKEEGFWKNVGHKILPSAGFQAPPRQDLWGQPLRKGEGWGSATDFLVRALLPIKFQRVVEPFNLDRMIKNWNNEAESKGYREWWPELPSNKYLGREKGKSVQKIMDADTYSKYIALRGETALQMTKGLHWNFDNPEELDILRLQRIFEAAGKIAKLRIERSEGTIMRETKPGKRLLEQEKGQEEEQEE